MGRDVTNNSSLFAIVIEPKPLLADIISDCLKRGGYDVFACATHAAAATEAEAHVSVHLVVAAVPAPGEDGAGAYLLVARKRNPGMGVVVTVYEPDASLDGAPADAVRLLKPFSLAELEAAIARA